MTIRYNLCSTLIHQDRKVKIGPRFLRQAQVSAIKVTIELKHTYSMNPVPIMTGKLFNKCLIRGAINLEARQDKHKVYLQHSSVCCSWH